MKIQDGLTTLCRQLVIQGTPKGRPITAYAIESLQSVMQDTKNHQNELAACLGCGFVNSILLFEDGCPNCNVIDIKTDLKQGDI